MRAADTSKRISKIRSKIKVEEVIDITRGLPSPSKLGSRGIPHRLSNKERIIFDRACREGVLKLPFKGVRKNLQNAYWLYCETQKIEYRESDSKNKTTKNAVPVSSVATQSIKKTEKSIWARIVDGRVEMPKPLPQDESEHSV